MTAWLIYSSHFAKTWLIGQLFYAKYFYLTGYADQIYVFIQEYTAKYSDYFVEPVS